MSLYKDASLVMLPSAYKDGKLYSIRPTDGSGDFTFSRGSNLAATRVDVNGLIEKGRENLLLYSNQFDTTWGSATSTLTSGQSGYDGSNDAWKIAKNQANAQINQSYSDTSVKTLSIYAKADTLNWIAIVGATGSIGYFDLVNGVVGTTGGSVIDANIESAGGGWWRCSVSSAATTSSVTIYPADADNDISGTSGSIYIQDAQLEAGLVATDYIETGASTAQAGILEDMPRLDYSGGASCPALLLEPQRSNIVTQSEYFGSDWNNYYVSYTGNVTTSPEGVNNASLIYAAANHSAHYFEPSVHTGTAGQDYVFSFFAKAGGSNFVQIATSTGFGSATYQNFNLSNGTLGNGDAIAAGYEADIEDYGNGWYRCWVKAAPTSNNARFLIIPILADIASRNFAFTGDGSTGFYMYGVQKEAASYPTSYIPTYGSSVTRQAEGKVNRTSNPIFFDSNENFTLFFDGEFNNPSFNAMIMGGRTISNSYWWIQNYQSGKLNSHLGTEMANWTGMNLQVNTRYKMLVVRNENVITFYLNGVALNTNQTAYSADSYYFNSLGYGFNDAASYAFNGKLNQAAVFPTALTDSECIALTSI